MSIAKISIIIPVYNTEKYLSKCLDSVTNQTLKDIEIVIINDCTPDDSEKIILEYKSKDDRIVYLKHEKNLGLGGVRNTGIKHATGEYQWHIDSDDFIDINACDILYSSAKKFRVDILTFSACNYIINNNQYSYYDNYFSRDKALCNKVYKGEDFLKEARKRGVFHCALWLNLIKSSVLKDFSKHFLMRENAAHQDTDYTPILYCNMQSVYCIHYTPYYRIIRDDSVTGSGETRSKMVDKFAVTRSLLNYIEKNELYLEHPLTEFAIKDFKYFVKIYNENFQYKDSSFDELINNIYHSIDNIRKLDDFQKVENLSKLTIMVKTFLRPEMIFRFLESVGEYQIKNKLKFAEILVGDDSDEDTIKQTEAGIKKIIDKYPDLNIKYHKYEYYIGCSEARNRMIDSIDTDYFLYCDDDYIFDDKCDLSSVIDLLESNNIDLISGWWKNYSDLNHDYHVLNFVGNFDLQSETVTCTIYNNFLPEYHIADYHTNFYIARTDKINKLKWDSDLKTEEHPEFFLRAYKKNLNMAFTNKLFIKHHHAPSTRYEEFRSISKGGKNYLFLRLKKSGIKKWVAYYLSDFTVRKWLVDYENKTNCQSYYFMSQASKSDYSVKKALIPVYNQRVKIKRLTPEFEHFFFGYFDIQAMNNKGEQHLALRVPFANRLPNENDSAEIVIINKDGNIRTIDKTYAWNFQQGAFFQYRPNYDNQVVYNIFDKDKNEYKSVIYNLESGEKIILPLPIANISPDGRKALSLNFSRLFDYRPGYGYCNIKDPHFDEIKPKDDGVFLIDLEARDYKLILSYQRLWELFSKGSKNEADKVIINHINFNTDGSRFLMLYRYFSDSPPFPTLTLTADINGENIHKIFGFGSHYHWKNSRDLVISGADIHDRSELKSMTAYNIEDISGKHSIIDENFLKGDGHCSYSPDRKFILYDSYPTKGYPYKKLQIYDLEKKKGVTLAILYSDPDIYNNITDCRCDFHPRWSPDGNHITFDSIHEGFRGIYSIDATAAIHEIDNEFQGISEEEIKQLISPTIKKTSPVKPAPMKPIPVPSSQEMMKLITARDMSVEVFKRVLKKLKLYSFLQKVSNKYKIVSSN